MFTDLYSNRALLISDKDKLLCFILHVKALLEEDVSGRKLRDLVTPQAAVLQFTLSWIRGGFLFLDAN
jgi:hypothetical protein